MTTAESISAYRECRPFLEPLAVPQRLQLAAKLDRYPAGRSGAWYTMGALKIDPLVYTLADLRYRIALMGPDLSSLIRSNSTLSDENTRIRALNVSDKATIKALGANLAGAAANIDASLSKTETQEIIKLHEGIASSMRRSVAEAIHIGELLSKAKENLDHGMFIPYIEQELPFDERTARRYMSLWAYKDKTVSLSDLQSAYKKVEQLESEAAQKERERRDHLIAEKARTGVKPSGWDRSTAREEKKREDDAGARRDAGQILTGERRGR